MDKIINISLLSEPLNWLTVWTMLLVLWLLFEVISRHPAAQAVSAETQ